MSRDFWKEDETYKQFSVTFFKQKIKTKMLVVNSFQVPIYLYLRPPQPKIINTRACTCALVE